MPQQLGVTAFSLVLVPIFQIMKPHVRMAGRWMAAIAWHPQLTVVLVLGEKVLLGSIFWRKRRGARPAASHGHVALQAPRGTKGSLRNHAPQITTPLVRPDGHLMGIAALAELQRIIMGRAVIISSFNNSLCNRRKNLLLDATCNGRVRNDFYLDKVNHAP